MSFVDEFDKLPLASLLAQSRQATLAVARESLGRSRLSLGDFANLISPAASELLEPICRRSQALTRQRFGKVIRLFAPLYLSNECVNICRYCGFSRNNSILRVTLSVDEVRQEGRELLKQGFRNILLVAGEHPKFVSTAYLAECVRALHESIPSLSLEVGTLDTDEYRPLVRAGADGLVIYQETYDRRAYADLHRSGPKRDFNWRLGTPERAYAAGFRRLGIAALYGLADWRVEALAVAAHAEHLLRNCWKASLTISVPRLRPCAGEFQPTHPLSDRDMVQLVGAYRLMFPDVGLVLSTREPARLRDGLIPAGHHTDQRRQPHRAGRLHRGGPGEAAPYRARAHRRAGRGRQRMGRCPRRQSRHRPIRHRGRAARRRSGPPDSPPSATSRSGRIGTRR